MKTVTAVGLLAAVPASLTQDVPPPVEDFIDQAGVDDTIAGIPPVDDVEVPGFPQDVDVPDFPEDVDFPEVEVDSVEGFDPAAIIQQIIDEEVTVDTICDAIPGLTYRYDCNACSCFDAAFEIGDDVDDDDDVDDIVDDDDEDDEDDGDDVDVVIGAAACTEVACEPEASLCFEVDDYELVEDDACVCIGGAAICPQAASPTPDVVDEEIITAVDDICAEQYPVEEIPDHYPGIVYQHGCNVCSSVTSWYPDHPEEETSWCSEQECPVDPVCDGHDDYEIVNEGVCFCVAGVSVCPKCLVEEVAEQNDDGECMVDCPDISVDGASGVAASGLAVIALVQLVL